MADPERTEPLASAGPARGASAHAAITPDKPAGIFEDMQVTYADVHDRANRLARVLAEMGITRDTTVACILPNGLEMIDVSVATVMLGARFLPLNWHLKRDELQFLLNDSEARVVVTHPSLAEVASRALLAAPGCASLVVGPEYEAKLERAGSGVERHATTAPTFMFYTSGTTARPKGIVWGASNPGLVFERQAGLWGWSSNDTYVMTGPAYHSAHSGWLATSLFIGATAVIMPTWNAEEWLRLIERHRATLTFMVPAHFIRFLELPKPQRDRYDVSSLRLIVHAGAPCPPTVKRQMMDALPGCDIFELYGGSEGGGTRISPTEWLEHPGSVGRPWPGTSIRILGEGGVDRPAGHAGLICFVPPAGSPRFEYHRDPEHTAEAWTDDGFTIGDIGYVDDDGYLYITDRQSDMILWGGVNIAPHEIETALHSYDGVIDCAVFGIPDARDGEHIMAVVEARPGVRTEDLAAHVRGLLADYKVPHRWELVAELPRDPNGKILKRYLRESYWEQAPGELSGKRVAPGDG